MRAAANWIQGIGVGQRTVILAYVLLAFIFTFIYVFYPVLFVALCTEDRLVEWVTALSYLFASLLFLRAMVYQSRSHVAKVDVWFLLFLSLGCLFVGGEEISWGQRLIGFSTPESIRQYNFQNEVTVHNLGDWGRDGPRRLYMLGVFAYVVLFPIAHGAFGFVRRLTAAFHIIVPPKILIVPFACSMALSGVNKLNHVLGFGWSLRTDYAAEVMELFSGLLFLHFSILESRRTRHAAG